MLAGESEAPPKEVEEAAISILILSIRKSNLSLIRKK